MADITTVQCPSCQTSFPVDPLKIPVGGARTQCTVCDAHFRVDRPEPEVYAAADLEAPAWDSLSAPELGDAPDSVVEPLEAMEAGDVQDGLEAWHLDAGDDWVLETEADGLSGSTDLEVERLDTVEGSLGIEGDELLSGTGDSGFDVTFENEFEAEFETMADAGLEPEPEVMLEVEPEAVLDGEAEGVLEVEPEVTFEAEAVLEVEPEVAFEAEAEERAARESAEEMAPEPEPAAEPEPEAPREAPAGFQPGRRDPHDKARRLARVLVSDMITYNPDRHARALQAGTLAEDFEDEMEKSWAEYVEQVGHELAESTPYWNEALNEILAKGQALF